jgi:very-short-patch-repair endonuclease/endogenous inhibitor of DNA gyrase (YacG/DUF329 family)
MFKKGIHYSPDTEFKEGVPNYIRMKEPVVLICQVCGKEFKVKPYKAKVRRFCSRDCWYKSPEYIHIKGRFKKGIPHPSQVRIHEFKCQYCGKIVQMRGKKFNNGRIFCSKGCAEKGQRRSYYYYKGHKRGLGTHRSEATKQKFREIMIERFKDPAMRDKQKICGVKSMLAQSNKIQHTSIEIKVYNTLKELGILFEKQYVVNDKFIVDAYIPSMKIVIECDGDYWHSLDKQIKRDRVKDDYLTKCGYKMLRLSEYAIHNGEYLTQLQGVLCDC